MSLRPRALRWVAAVLLPAVMLLSVGGTAWADREYKPLPAQLEKGAPVHIRIYHQPYYTESWSSSVMKNKEFWKKYLPAGSTVTFEFILMGALAIPNLLAGKGEYAYAAPGISVLALTTPREKQDLRAFWINAYSNCCYCNVMLVPADAPYLDSAEAYVKSLKGKTVSASRAACTDQWFRMVYKRYGIEPANHLHQTWEVGRTALRTKRIDATSIWEPHASGVWLQDKTARPVATGGAFGMEDMSTTFGLYKWVKDNTRAHIALAKAEIESQLWMMDPKNEKTLVEFMAKETEGYSRLVLWHSLYGRYPDEIGGTLVRGQFPMKFTDDAKRHMHEVADFWWELKMSNEPKLDPDDILDEHIQIAAKELGITLPLEGAFITGRSIDKSPFYDPKALEGVPPVVKKK